jgi:hypothetical protein
MEHMDLPSVHLRRWRPGCKSRLTMREALVRDRLSVRTLALLFARR